MLAEDGKRKYNMETFIFAIRSIHVLTRVCMNAVVNVACNCYSKNANLLTFYFMFPEYLYLFVLFPSRSLALLSPGCISHDHFFGFCDILPVCFFRGYFIFHNVHSCILNVKNVHTKLDG